MISGVNVRVDASVLDAIRETARKAPGLMTTAYTRATRRLRARMLNDLRQAGKPVVYPIRWQSAKQRRAFFATNGFGGGIPSQRTGALEAGYDVVVAPLDSNAAALVITNNQSHQPFVSGDRVQLMHIDRWVQTVDVAIEYEAEANDVLTVTWYVVSFPEI